MAEYWPWVIRKRQAKEDNRSQEDLIRAQEAAEQAVKAIHEEMAKGGHEDSQEGGQVQRTAAALAADAILYSCKLRAYWAAVNQFVEATMVPAKNIWDARVCREETVKKRRAAALEQLIFTTFQVNGDTPCADYCSEEFLSSNTPQLPVLCYVDMNQRVAAYNMERVLQAVEKGGAFLAFVTDAPGMTPMLLQEKELMDQVTEQQQRRNDLNVRRFFLRAKTDKGETPQMIGNAYIAWFGEANNARSPLQERMFASPAFTNGYLLDLPNVNQEERVRQSTGHDVCPEQRPTAFHTAILEGFGIMPSGVSRGTSSMDCFFAELECCTATLAQAVVNASIEFAKGTGRTDTHALTRVYLASQVHQHLAEKRSSMTFRMGQVQKQRERLQALLNMADQRTLKRANSETAQQLDSMAQSAPDPPPLPEMLRDNLAVDYDPAPIMPTGRHVVNSIVARPLPESRPRPPDDFETFAPPGLATALMSKRSKVVVAPSKHIKGTNGLFAASGFVKGQPICSGQSVDGGWMVATEERRMARAGSSAPLRTLMVDLCHDIFPTRDVRVELVGNPLVHVWANMNSSEGRGRE